MRFLNFASATAVFFILIHLSRALSGTTFYVFQERDLFRAAELLKGNLIFYGPEMTGGGNLPGPLYYVLLAVSLIVNPSWFSAWVLLVVVTCATALLGWYYFRKEGSPVTGWIWLGIFSASPEAHFYIRRFLNVSYLYPFAIVSLIGMCLAYGSPNPRTKRLAFIIACLFAGLSLQLHFSAFAFIAALVSSEFLAARLKVQPVGWKTFGWGLTAFLAPSLPYLIWRAAESQGIHFGQPAFYAGESKKAIVSLVHMMDYVIALPWNEVLINSMKRIFIVCPLTLPVAALSFYLYGKQTENRDGAKIPLAPLLVCAAFSAIPFAYWFFVSIGFRYTIPFSLTLNFINGLLIYRILSSQETMRGYLTAGMAVFVGCLIFIGMKFHTPFNAIFLILTPVAFAVVLIGLISQELRRSGPVLIACLTLSISLSAVQRKITEAPLFFPEPMMMPQYGEWKRVWSKVYEQTGWTYDEAIHRTYFLGHHIEQYARPAYESAMESIRPPAVQSTPDGYFISLVERPGPMRADVAREWLLKHVLQQEIRDGILDGRIVTGPSRTKSVVLIPYSVKGAGLPRTFHNYGRGYLTSVHEEVLNANEDGAKDLGDNRFLFKWNECPDRNPYCSTGAVVTTSNPARNQVKAKVEVVGMPISQVSPWIAPAWTQAWIEPFVELKCGGKTERKILATSIGYERRYAVIPSHLLIWGNNSMVAPFEIELEFSCKGGMQSITVGRQASKVETLYELTDLSPGSLTVTLTDKSSPN